MKGFISTTIGAAASAAAIAFSLTSPVAALADGGTYDIQIPNRKGFAEATTQDGAIVSYIGDSNTTFGSSGSGIFDSFVRLQGAPTEQGYNTDGAVQFNTKAGTFTRSMLVSEIPLVTVNGNEYWEIFCDTNEGNSAKKVSLDKFEVYFTDNPALTGYPFALTPEYAFDGAILMNDVNQGSGRGDLRYLVPVTTIPPGCEYGAVSGCDTYFVLYSKWGGTFPSEGGFEEWKVKIYETSITTSQQEWLPNDTASATWTTATNLSGSFSFTLYDGPDCGATGNGILRDTETIPFTDVASPASASTTNTTVSVTQSSVVSWKVVFSPTTGGVLGSQHCESSDLIITN